MSRRILVAEESKTILSAVRGALEGAGFTVDAVSPALAAAGLEPGRYAAAIVRSNAVAEETVKALRAADPHLPVVALFLDGEEAAEYPGAFGADGVLVGPLTAPGVTGICRMAARLREASHRIAELEVLAAQRARTGRDLEFLKKLLLVEVKRSKRYGYPVSLALLSVDGWAETAPRLGARARTEALAEVLSLVSASVRDIDIAVPFAEERIVVLMPHTRAEGGIQVARRLCARIREHPGRVKVTASVGVAAHDGDRTISFGGLVKRAAEALTRARLAGGDRAEPADPPRRRDRISMG
jgi:diguanylate cyclase (GGDEF)-like protein